MRQALSFLAIIFAIAFFLLILLALFGGPSTKANLLPVKADFQSISSAVKSYRMETGDYPTTDQGLMSLVERPEALRANTPWTQIATRIPMDPWKNEYLYRRLAENDPRGFELRCIGPDGIDGNDDDRSSLAPPR